MPGFKKRLSKANALQQQKRRMTEDDAYRVGAKKGGKMKKKKSFPDMSGDGKVTKKDILMARGIIKKPMKKKK